MNTSLVAVGIGFVLLGTLMVVRARFSRAGEPTPLLTGALVVVALATIILEVILIYDT